MILLSKKHISIFLLITPFVCSQPLSDDDDLGSGDTEEIGGFNDDDCGTYCEDNAPKFNDGMFLPDDNKDVFTMFESGTDEVCGVEANETQHFQPPKKPMNIEAATWKRPILAQHKDFLSYSLIMDPLDKNSLIYYSIFANVHMPTKYSLLGNDVWVENGEQILQEKIDESYYLAFEKSCLASFRDNMDSVRPYLAYALGISWNIDFYEIDQAKLDGSEIKQKNLEIDVLKNEKYRITDEAKKHIGNIYSYGPISQVSSKLRDVEFKFEEFVVDVRVWCTESLGSTYEVVKNVQRAMRSVLIQDEYMQYAEQYQQTDPARIEMLQAVVAERQDMVNDLAKINPILAILMEGIENLEAKIDGNSGMRSVLIDAQEKTKSETQMAKKQDKDHKLAEDKIFRRLKKVNNWLDRNQASMQKTEDEIDVNAIELNKKLEKKREIQQRYEESLEKANKRIAANEDEREKLYKQFNDDVEELYKDLKKEQEQSNCKVDLAKQITQRVTHCQKSSTTYERRYYTSCRWFLWICYRRYTSYTTIPRTRYWTDQSCYNSAKAEMDRKSKLHWTNEEKRCESLRKTFEKKIATFQETLEKRQEMFDNRGEQIDTLNKEEAENKVQYKKYREGVTQDIQRQKKELLDKRSELLIKQHNQIKAEELGRIFKGDLEDNLQEFESYTDTLKLTNMSLKEVDEALRRISTNLKQFKVGLKVFEEMIKNQISDFESIKSKVSTCAGKGFRGDKCFEITKIYLARKNLKKIQFETFEAGVGSVVLGRLYNVLYRFLTNLKAYPVDLYDPDLGVKENVDKFKEFVKKMNAQQDYFGKSKRRERLIEQKISYINSMRTEKGLAEVKVVSEIEEIIDFD